MSELFLSLLNRGLVASFIVLILVLLRPLAKRVPKWICVALWSLVAIRLITPFTLQSVISLIPSATPVPPAITMQAFPRIDSGISAINSAINPILSQAFAAGCFSYTDAIVESVTPMGILIAVLSQIWLIGMVAMLIYAAASTVRLYRRVSPSLPLEGEKGVRICDRIDTPFILGILRPRIYLPSGISSQAIPSVLSHERTHLRRWDHIWKPFGFLLLSVYWFHPLLWLGYYFLCRDIELSCDERVIERMDVEERKEYSRLLLSYSVKQRLISACPLAFGEGSVKGRIRSVLHYKRPTLWIILIALAASIIASVVLLTDPPKPSGVAYEDGLRVIRVIRSPKGANAIWLLSNQTPRSDRIPTLTISSHADLSDLFAATEDSFALHENEDFLALASAIHRDPTCFKKRILIISYLSRDDLGVAYRMEQGSGELLAVFSHAYSAQPWPQDGNGVLLCLWIDRDLGEGKQIGGVLLTGTVADLEQQKKTKLLATYRDRSVSPDVCMPTVALYEDGSFQFFYSMLSSRICHGRYRWEGDLLMLTEENGNNYIFHRNDRGIVFDAARSAPIEQFSFRSEEDPKPAVSDGLLLENAYNAENPDSRYHADGTDDTRLISLKVNAEVLSVETVGLPTSSAEADLDGDGQIERCTLHPGFLSGISSHFLQISRDGRLLLTAHVTMTGDTLTVGNDGAMYLSGGGHQIYRISFGVGGLQLTPCTEIL